jgi:hypothetical protein
VRRHAKQYRQKKKRSQETNVIQPVDATHSNSQEQIPEKVQVQIYHRLHHHSLYDFLVKTRRSAPEKGLADNLQNVTEKLTD